MSPPDLAPGFIELLRGFGLRGRQRSKVWAALLENPEGLERCGLRARAVGLRNGNTGAGLLLAMIEAGEHRLECDPLARRVTGWRFARGTHGGTYVRDMNGTDPLPEWYDAAVRTS